MTLFLRVLLAHFLADFPFQTSKLFELKTRKAWGNLLHASIFFALALSLAFPFIDDLWPFTVILALSILHFFIDRAKIKIFSPEGANNLWGFLMDQAAHILPALILLAFPSPKAAHFQGCAEFLNDDRAIILAIGLVVSSYVASFFLYYIKNTFIDPKLLYRRDWAGMVERPLIVLCVLAGGKLLVLVPVIVILKAAFYLSFAFPAKERSEIIKRNEPPLEYQKIKLKSILSVDLAGSPALAVIIGMALSAL